MRLVAFRKKDAAYCPTRSTAPSKSLEQNSYIFLAWNSSESRAQRPYKPSSKHFQRFFYIITFNLLIIQKFVSRIEWKKLLIKPITESPRNKPVEPPISASNWYLVTYSDVKLIQWFLIQLRSKKARSVWCGGERETHWATCHNEVTPSKTKEIVKCPCFFRSEWYIFWNRWRSSRICCRFAMDDIHSPIKFFWRFKI